ncbi:MAG: phytanoyl-CoA dioxygenase family protein [Caldilineaceae bacterium]|nr:phytanoyl-CoA dioxygenase family protein [Caldilineaceae bacterium]
MNDLSTRMKLDGWCVVEKVIPTDAVAAVRDAVAAATERHRNPNAPKSIGHLSGVINYDQSFAPYLVDERLLSVIEGVLGPQVRISFTSATINEPGNARGGWHADWPYNQRNAGCIPAPYADLPMHITTIWMLTPFRAETGGTLVVSGSHRMSNNPTGGYGIGELESYPTEVNASGEAGDVLVMDSRLWHATAANLTNGPRVAIVIRYAPWWLDLSVLQPGSAVRQRMTQATGKGENSVPAVPAAVYAGLPEPVKPLFSHWVVG